MDWLCPGYTTVLNAQLTKYHGNITAENTIRDVTSIVQTGACGRGWWGVWLATHGPRP